MNITDYVYKRMSEIDEMFENNDNPRRIKKEVLLLAEELIAKDFEYNKEDYEQLFTDIKSAWSAAMTIFHNKKYFHN